jgi:hypothetical protein
MMREHIERATRLIEACERDLNRKLSQGERRDLLADNTPWTLEYIRKVVDRLHTEYLYQELKGE